MVVSKESAIKVAIKLTELNIQSANQWIPADLVTEFMEDVYNHLTGKETHGS